MKRSTAASSLLVVLIGCGGDQAADPLPVSAVTTAPLVDSTHLVEVVTEAHFGAKVAASVRESTQTEAFEGTLDEWTSGYGDGGELAPQAGRDGSTAVAFGPGTKRFSTYLSRRFEVKRHHRCTVSVWVRTDALIGSGLQAGARMELAELVRSKKKDSDGTPRLAPRQVYRHLPHLAGTVPWTLQQVRVDVASKTRALEVRLTGGHDGRVYIGGGNSKASKGESGGTAWFDDLSVRCEPPGFPDGPGTAVAGAQDDSVVRRVTVNEDNRPAVLVDGTAAWSVQVDRSKPYTLSTAVGLLEGTHRKARVCFAVRVDGELLKRQCRNGDSDKKRAWRTMELELPARSDLTSTVSFETQMLSASGVGPTLGAWADPWLRGTAAPPQRPPDVLVILVDTLRADSVNAADGRRPGSSPAMDALAAEGTLYTQARSPTSWTLPSTATLLTGMHPFRHGAGWRMRRGGRTSTPKSASERRLHYSGVVDGTPRMASLLREHGYLTRGWYSNHYLDPRFGMGTGFSRWVSFKSSDIPGAERAVTQVERALEAQPQGAPQPQLLFVHLIDPHLPYLARTPLPEGFALSDVLKLEERVQGERTAMVLDSTSSQTRDHVEAVREIYDIDVHYLDEMVGRLVSLVDEDTLVIVTSDHGEAFVEHGVYQHGAMLYDEVLRIPLLVRWPGGSHAGSRVDHPVALADVTATVLATAGIAPESLDGRPLPLPDTQPPPRPLVFSHIYNGPDRVGVLDWPHKRMVQLPSLGLDPLIRQARFPSDLYDLSVDPTEQHDLSDSEPEVLARLDALVAEQIAASVPGTHLRCRVPHAPVSLQSEQAFVRGVPLSAGEITVSDDRRELTVEAAASGDTRLVVEASQAAEVRVSPADACEMWRVAVPDMEVSLDQDQVENLRAIGYME